MCLSWLPTERNLSVWTLFHVHDASGCSIWLPMRNWGWKYCEGGAKRHMETEFLVGDARRDSTQQCAFWCGQTLFLYHCPNIIFNTNYSQMFVRASLILLLFPRPAFFSFSSPLVRQEMENFFTSHLGARLVSSSLFSFSLFHIKQLINAQNLNKIIYYITTTRLWERRQRMGHHFLGGTEPHTCYFRICLETFGYCLMAAAAAVLMHE